MTKKVVRWARAGAGVTLLLGIASVWMVSTHATPARTDEAAEATTPDKTEAGTEAPGEEGQPRRRRRRRRRGKGGSGAGSEAGAQKEPSEAQPEPAPEVIVPKTVRADELMPAAVGARGGRKKRNTESSGSAPRRRRKTPARSGRRRGGRRDTGSGGSTDGD